MDMNSEFQAFLMSKLPSRSEILYWELLWCKDTTKYSDEEICRNLEMMVKGEWSPFIATMTLISALDFGVDDRLFRMGLKAMYEFYDYNGGFEDEHQLRIFMNLKDSLKQKSKWLDERTLLNRHGDDSKDRRQGGL